MAWAPWAAMISRQRAVMRRMASSQEMGLNAPLPLGPAASRGEVSRSGECTVSW